MSTGFDTAGQSSFSLMKYLREAPSWAVSLGVHLTALLFVLVIPMPKIVHEAADLFSSMEDLSAEEQFEEVAVQDVVGTELKGEAFNPGQLAGASAGGSLQAAMTISGDSLGGSSSGGGDNESPDMDIAPEIDGMSVPKNMYDKAVPSGKGSVETPEGGTGGSIDRLAQELQLSLREKRTVAMWLFDASLSLKTRRNLIADRFENVYRQLDALEASKNTGLSTVVASFGKDYNLITKEPVNDIRSVVPKVRAIKDDVSGQEFVFTAVKNLAQTFHKQKNQNGGQNLMLFIVTDERGNDIQMLEEAIMLCRKYSIKVYVIGNASLLGREESFVHWKYEDGFEEDIKVEGGPETLEPDMVTLGFFGVADATDLTRMSAGYGPYALTRLCKETNGSYFIAEESANVRKFPQATMRAYAPDYRPYKQFETDVKKSVCKQALIEAAKASKKTENIPMPSLKFRADSDNTLKDQIAEAQKPAAVVGYSVDALLTILAKGEKDRPKVKELRWRAAYDLAMGRCLAMKARFLGYNKMLAEMRGTPKAFKTKGSDEWRLEPSKDIDSGAEVKKLAGQANVYLKRCADENPDTPWGMLALRELSTPMGWQWKEATANYQKMDRDQAEAKRRAQFADEATKKKMMQPAAPARAKPVL